METEMEALKILQDRLGPGPFTVEYGNDVGPNDDGFWEWWEVAGVKFDVQETAEAFAALLNSDTACPRIEPPPSEAKSDRRDPGFYWVEEGYSLWVPAEWTEVQHQGGPIGGYWTIPGSEIEHQDSDFTAIGDKLVQPPHRKMETGSEPHWNEPPPTDGEPGW